MVGGGGRGIPSQNMANLLKCACWYWCNRQGDGGEMLPALDTF